MRWRLIITSVERVWWFPLLKRQETITMVSPEGTTREVAEEWRQRFLSCESVVGARLEEA